MSNAPPARSTRVTRLQSSSSSAPAARARTAASFLHTQQARASPSAGADAPAVEPACPSAATASASAVNVADDDDVMEIAPPSPERAAAIAARRTAALVAQEKICLRQAAAGQQQTTLSFAGGDMTKPANSASGSAADAQKKGKRAAPRPKAAPASDASAAVSASASAAAASSSMCITPPAPAPSHSIGYHAFLPSQLPDLRARLLRWYDAHRRLLPWRGDAPDDVARDAARRAAAAGGASKGKRKQPPAAAAAAAAAAEAKEEQSGDAMAEEDSSEVFSAAASSSSAAASSASSAAATAPPPSSARSSVSAYGTMVSELMLQQTQVDRVLPFYTRWMARFPTVHALAEASAEDVQRLWAGLGYYRRSRFLHDAAKLIVEKHAGGFPRTLEAIRSLPGVGPYTAGAIGSIAFGLVTPLVDGNVIRVLSRLRAIAVDAKDLKAHPPLWTLATRLLDPLRPGDFNQSLMELGATVCTPAQPRCGQCPVREHCYAYKEVQQKRRPCELTVQEQAESQVVASSVAASPSASSVLDIEDLTAEANDAPAVSVGPPPAAAAAAGAPRSRSKAKRATVDLFATPLAPCSLCLPPTHENAGFPSSVTAYPAPVARKAPLAVQLHTCVLKRGGAQAEEKVQIDEDAQVQYLLTRRPPTGLLASQWEFPTVESPHTDVPSASLRASLASLLSLSPDAASSMIRFDKRSLADVSHTFSHRVHAMRVWQATLVDSAEADAAAASADASHARKKQRVAIDASPAASHDDAVPSSSSSAAPAAPAAPPAVRWVSLADLQQDVLSPGDGSELGLTSGVRKIVQRVAGAQ